MSRRRSRKQQNDHTLLLLIVLLILLIAAGGGSATALNGQLLGVGATLALIAVSLIAAYAWYKYRRQAAIREGLRHLELEQVDTMTGEAFEKYVGVLLERHGFQRIRYTARSNDDGIDLLAHKDGQKYAIQAKRYHGKVGKEHVYPVHSAHRQKRYDCDKAMIVTNSYFTPNARKYAENSGVILVDRDTLAEWRHDPERAN